MRSMSSSFGSHLSVSNILELKPDLAAILKTAEDGVTPIVWQDMLIRIGPLAGRPKHHRRAIC